MLGSVKNVMRLPVRLALGFCWAGTLMTGMKTPNQVNVFNRNQLGSLEYINPKKIKLYNYIDISVLRATTIIFSSPLKLFVTHSEVAALG